MSAHVQEVKVRGWITLANNDVQYHEAAIACDSATAKRLIAAGGMDITFHVPETSSETIARLEAENAALRAQLARHHIAEPPKMYADREFGHGL